MDFKTFTAFFFMLACFLKLSDAQITGWTLTDTAGTAITNTGATATGTGVASIDEGKAVGTTLFTAVGAPTTGGATVTYEFDTDGNPGSIAAVSSAGVVTIASGMSLDFEGGTTSYVIKVKATEASDAAKVGVATVTLTVNDAIVYTQLGYTVCLSSTSLDAAASIGTFASTDALSTQTVSYAVSGTDASKFTVTPATGAVVTASAISSLEKSQWTFVMTASSTGVGDGTTTVIVALGCSSGAGQIAALTGVLLLSLFTSLFC